MDRISARCGRNWVFVDTWSMSHRENCQHSRSRSTSCAHRIFQNKKWLAGGIADFRKDPQRQHAFDQRRPFDGKKVTPEDFLGFGDTVFTVIPENTEREFLHFMGLGYDKYSFSKAYLSGHLDNKKREYSFTTNQHGEHRPFIDSTLYDKVMPLNVPTMLLVKAVMAEDFEVAETLGLLEVDSEDFALPTFVCPSKMEMTEIIKTGLKQYAKEVLI